MLLKWSLGQQHCRPSSQLGTSNKAIGIPESQNSHYKSLSNTPLFVPLHCELIHSSAGRLDSLLCLSSRKVKVAEKRGGSHKRYGSRALYGVWHKRPRDSFIMTGNWWRGHRASFRSSSKVYSLAFRQHRTPHERLKTCGVPQGSCVFYDRSCSASKTYLIHWLSLMPQCKLSHL